MQRPAIAPDHHMRPFQRGFAIAATTVLPGLLLLAACYVLLIIYLLIETQTIEINGIEAYFIYFIQRVLSGKAIYTALELPPYFSNGYTPLYYYLAAGIADFVGVDASDVESLFRVARLTSLGVSIALGGVIFGLVRREFGTNSCVALASAIVGLMHLFPWTISARGDSLYLLLGTLGFWFSLRFLRHERWADFILSVLFIMFAFMAKQTAILFAALIGVNLLLFARRQVVLYATVIGALLIISFIGLTYAVYGAVFFENIVGPVGDGISLRRMLQNAWAPLFRSHSIAILIFFVAVLFFWTKSQRSFRPVCVAAGLSLLIGAVLSMKGGSSINYFNEFFVLTAILFGAILGALSKRRVRDANLAQAIRIFAGASAVVMVLTGFVANAQTMSRILYAQDFSSLRDVVQIVEAHRAGVNGVIFTDSVRLTVFLQEPLILPQWRSAARAASTGALDLTAAFRDFRSRDGSIAVVRARICRGRNGDAEKTGKTANQPFRRLEKSVLAFRRLEKRLLERLLEGFSVVSVTRGYCILSSDGSRR